MKALPRYLIAVTFALMALTLSAKTGSVYDYTLNSIDGKPTSIGDFKGKVVMLVNVASRCGFTPQYEKLEALYKQYAGKGFTIIGIPANNFLSQEPGTNAEIKTFCKSKYSVTFPMMAKISVKGSDQAPLYKFLTDKSSNPQFGGPIQWNFTKFLVDRNGKVVNRFEPAVTPDDPSVTTALQKAL